MGKWEPQKKTYNESLQDGKASHGITEKSLTASYFRCVQRNLIEELKEVVVQLKKYISSNVINSVRVKKSGDSALHICATNGYLEMMKYLVVEEGANLEEQNLDGKTALHDAAQFSQPEIVNYLIAKGANVNVVKRADWTPLMLACTKQNIDIIRTLVDAKADLSFTNKDGWTCIHIAAREGNVDIVSYLLKSCKDPSRRKALIEKKSRNGRKAIHTAVMHGKVDVVKLLADESSAEELNGEDNCGTTPIMEASRFGFTEIVKFFVEHVEIKPKLLNKNGVGLLHVAAEANQGEMIQFLVNEYHLDVNMPSVTLSMTPLHWACREGNLAAAETLLRIGADQSFKDGKGRTAADLANMFKKNEVYEACLTHHQQQQQSLSSSLNVP